MLLTKDSFTYNKTLPLWLKQEYAIFNSIISQKDFPCTFGLAGQRKGELRYSYITHQDWSNLPRALESFNELFHQQDKLIRYGFFLFVEPEHDKRSLEYYRSYFWRVLQYLHENDRYQWPENYPLDPDHHLWNFCFANEPYFVFGNAPAYQQRKTRDLGNSLIIGFQPRRIFKGLEGISENGRLARESIRARVKKWDRLPTHPNISHYGDRNHREWKQYFIGDDTELITGECPFIHKSLK